jgi:hypothetical protein
MRKLITLALVTLVGSGIAASSASAYGWMSVAKGRQQVRLFNQEVANGLDDVISTSVRGCFRRTAKSVECTSIITFSDMTCESQDRADWKSWTYIRVHGIGKAHCY